MNREFIVEIEKRDSDDMEKIFDRMCSLDSLGHTLIDNNEYADKASQFYKRFVDDWNDIQKKYRARWSYIVEKYSLNADLINNYELSFAESCVYLKK